jgi:hypothetical protein
MMTGKALDADVAVRVASVFLLKETLHEGESRVVFVLLCGTDGGVDWLFEGLERGSAPRGFAERRGEDFPCRVSAVAGRHGRGV